MGAWARHSLQDTIGTTQEATVVGFDKRKIQPDLKQIIKLGIEHRDLSKRVRWVHGDLCVHPVIYASLRPSSF